MADADPLVVDIPPPPVEGDNEDDTTPRQRHSSDAGKDGDPIEVETSSSPTDEAPLIPTAPTPPPAPPVPPSSGGAEERDEDDENDGDSLSDLPMPFVSNEEMMRQSEADAGGVSKEDKEGGGGFFGALRQRRRSSIPVIASTHGAGATLEGKIHGTCLCRISMRSYFMKDWKPCMWVFENDKQLYVFRDADAYKMYHENSYLDDETKKFLLKGYFVLGVNHGCKPISHKEFNGEVVHGFSLEKITDFGSSTCVKFGHKDCEPLGEMRDILKGAIDRLIIKRDEEEQEADSINLEDVFSGKTTMERKAKS